MLPNVTFDYDSRIFTFTLLRDEKKVTHELKGMNVILEVIPDDDYDRTKNVKHYIYVQPYEGEDILIWLSKEEYDVLDPIMFEIEEDIYHNFYECEFTSKTYKDMAKNPTEYGPEQLARAMMCCPDCGNDLSGSIYRPRCSDCDWNSDSHNAYREHPLDHE